MRDAPDEPDPARPSSADRSGPSPTKVSVPSPRRSNARASRRTFFRSESAPRQRNAVPWPCQPSSARASAASRGAKRSRSTPALTTSVLPRASGTASSSCARSHSDTAITRAARFTTYVVARADSGDRPDVPHVLTVRGDDERSARGDRADEAGRHEEVRVDDVRTGSSRRGDASSRGARRGGAIRPCGGRRPRARSRDRARRAPFRASRRRRRGPGRPAPGTSARRGGSAGDVLSTAGDLEQARGTSRRSCPRPRGCSAASSARRACRGGGATRRGGT